MTTTANYASVVQINIFFNEKQKPRACQNRNGILCLWLEMITLIYNFIASLICSKYKLNVMSD